MMGSGILFFKSICNRKLKTRRMDKMEVINLLRLWIKEVTLLEYTFSSGPPGLNIFRGRQE